MQTVSTALLHNKQSTLMQNPEVTVSVVFQNTPKAV